MALCCQSYQTTDTMSVCRMVCLFTSYLMLVPNLYYLATEVSVCVCVCVNDLPNVALDNAAAGTQPASSNSKSNAANTTSQSHISWPNAAVQMPVGGWAVCRWKLKWWQVQVTIKYKYYYKVCTRSQNALQRRPTSFIHSLWSLVDHQARLLPRLMVIHDQWSITTTTLSYSSEVSN